MTHLAQFLAHSRLHEVMAPNLVRTAIRRMGLGQGVPVAGHENQQVAPGTGLGSDNTGSWFLQWGLEKKKKKSDNNIKAKIIFPTQV